MRARPESLLIVSLLAFTLVGVAALFLDDVGLGAHDPVGIGDPVPGQAVTAGVDGADAWFAAVRPYCNSVEVETRLSWNPPPETERGTMNEAACFALAGRIDLARASLERLPADRRYEGAGVVFAAGHPVADAGDDLAAGPLMELVVEFWPNHYMALYHAGTAAWERGDKEAARLYLRRFLDEYALEDGWRSDAIAMLEAIGG
jgi:hypothetical protein